MLPIQYISKIIKILRSAASPRQIAAGFIMGMVLGLIPSLLNPLSLLLILLIIILNVNITTAIFGYAIFSGVAYFIDPYLHDLGYYFLVGLNELKNVWTGLYNAPVIPFTNFYNTVVMGSLLISLVLFLPVFWGTKKFVIVYREKYEPRVQNWKWIKVIKSTSLYQWYERMKFLGD